MNADQAELDKFGGFSQQWWEPVGEFELLQKVNPHRVGFVDQQVGLPGKRLLDVGCGGGLAAEASATRGALVTGLDLAPALIEAASAHARSRGISVEYLCKAVEALADERPSHYDVVTCFEMLEHVPQPSSIVQSIARLLKPGGHAFISTLDRTPRSFMAAIVGLEYVLRLLPVGTHAWSKFIRPGELRGMCEQAGLQLQMQQGILYNPLTEKFKIGPRYSVNYLLMLQKPR